MAERAPGTKFLIASRILKVLAILAGGALTVVSLMSLAGLVVDNGWIRLAVAGLLAVGVPLLVADRLLPDDADRGKGIVSDVFALGWLGFALLWVGLAIQMTRPLLHEQAERFEQAELVALANATSWIAGGAAETPAPAEDERGPARGGDAGASPAAARETGARDAAAEASAPSPADAGSTAPADAANRDDRAGMKPEEIFKAWAPAVVTIQIRGSAPHRQGGGTGFLIDDRGTLVTNQHVVGGASDVRIKLMDGTFAEEVELLVADEDADVALLGLSPAPEVDPVVVGDSDRVQVGERAIAIGNPLGLEHTLTDGLISARRVIQGQKLIQMSTPVSPGNSGGPLFNASGEVVGVTTAIYGHGIAQNLNLAVPINTVKELLAEDYPDRKRIGGGSGPNLGTW